MADAAPAAPSVPATPGNQSGTHAGQPNGKAAPATPPPTPKYKLDIGDGEQEYTQDFLRAVVGRGKSAAKTLSIAEKRAQEAAKKEQEAEARLAAFRSKDAKQIRAALRELGVDELELANMVGREKLEEMELTPEQKKIREYERREEARKEEEAKRQNEEKSAKEKAEEERHVGELSELFTSVMEKAGLPKESAGAVFPRIARLYEAVEGSGGQVDPDLAAERVKSALQAEHRALYWKPGTDGKPSLNHEALKAMLGDDAYKELRRAAVAEYRASKAGGVAPPPQPIQRTEPEPKPQKPGNFWKELERRVR